MLRKKKFQVPPAKLQTVSPRSTPGFGRKGKKQALQKLREEHERLKELQRVLFAENKRSLLVVLQAMDTGGKDGTIRGVFGPLNPQGVRVVGFKKPTREEARRHFLWRVKNALPAPGKIGVFNRSHYEDYLVPSVFGGLTASKLASRLRQIADFERELARRGTRILKFYLHISKEEQKERLQERLDDPQKHWKFDPRDLDVRKRWPEFMRSYSRIFSATSRAHAPWYLVPADKKWFRNYYIARTVRETLEAMKPRYPRSTIDPDDYEII